MSSLVQQLYVDYRSLEHFPETADASYEQKNKQTDESKGAKSLKKNNSKILSGFRKI